MSDVIEAFPARQRTPWVKPTDEHCRVFFETLQSNARTPRYAPTVMVHQHIRHGQVLYAPVNPLAQSFARLARRHDGKLTASDVELIRKEFGCDIEFVAGRE